MLTLSKTSLLLIETLSKPFKTCLRYFRPLLDIFREFDSVFKKSEQVSEKSWNVLTCLQCVWKRLEEVQKHVKKSLKTLETSVKSPKSLILSNWMSSRKKNEFCILRKMSTSTVFGFEGVSRKILNLLNESYQVYVRSKIILTGLKTSRGLANLKDVLNSLVVR